MILNQMIPNMPFPDDLAAGLARGLNLINGIDEHIARAGQLRLQAGGDEIGGRLSLPDVHQHIAVGHAGDRVMANLLFVVKLVVPDQLAVPGELLNASPLACAGEEGLVFAEIRGAKQMAVLEQIRILPGGVLAFPRVDNTALRIDEIGLRRLQRSDERVALKGVWLVDLHAELRRPRGAFAGLLIGRRIGGSRIR